MTDSAARRANIASGRSALTAGVHKGRASTYLARCRFILCIALVVATLASCAKHHDVPWEGAFVRLVVDAKGPREPWGKAFGDLDGDGRPDLVVGGRNGGGLVWYENPGWGKHVVSDGEFSTDHEIADVDGDGRNDIVSLTTTGIVWFHNPDWKMTTIAEQRSHDVETGDLDGDGRIDIVARGQSAFGGGGDFVFLYLQRDDGAWDRNTIDVEPGEGLKLADLDGDGRLDIVIGGTWLRNPGPRKGEWKAHRFASEWNWPHVSVDVGDINGDGRSDIVMTPSELAGNRYRISWFEAPVDHKRPWVEHVVDADVETAHHFVGLTDFDLDGRLDVATALMHQADAPREIRIYYNRGEERGWRKLVVATTGSHNMRVVDIDGDGDSDLFGANWSGERQDVEVWVNQRCSPAGGCPRWKRHEIDSQRPGKAVFIHAADLNGDGSLDVAAGGFWYRNPGQARGGWERRGFGSPANDAILLADLDGDSDKDVLATKWRPDKPDARFVFAENDGHGSFQNRADLPSGSGQFLQGLALEDFRRDGVLGVALSWHRSQDEADRGIELLTIPGRPATDPWSIEQISGTSQDEALSAGDIDRDGSIDLLLGTRWMRNDGGRWTIHRIDTDDSQPDRNRLADINGDGRLDAVVGFRAISSAGEVVWYEQGVDSLKPWKRNLVGTVVGPMSLDVADMDGDGDPDIVVGEHNLKNPETARLLVFENVDGRGGSWREHLIHTGDEHHDGALVVDLDGDGDPDIVSIGWEHGKVVWYENMGASDKQAAPMRRAGVQQISDGVKHK